MSEHHLCLYGCLTHPSIALALKWFGGDGELVEDYEEGRELEDLIK